MEKAYFYKVVQGGEIMAGKTAYKNKWQAENCERISLVVKKGRKQVIKDFATQQNDTLNGFINKAIDEKIQRDTAE
jgi:hypothetical protein